MYVCMYVDRRPDSGNFFKFQSRFLYGRFTDLQILTFRKFDV
jgi:hypothetical protein